jgi:hypothetical protein
VGEQAQSIRFHRQLNYCLTEFMLVRNRLPSSAWQLLVVLIPLGWLATSLPQSVLAWTLPDPEP